MQRTITTIASIAAAVTLSGVSAAHAQQDVSFSYYAHELTSSQGAESVYARLDRIARRACAPLDSRDFKQIRAQAACAVSLKNEIVAKINNPVLTAKHLDSVFIAQR